MTTATASVVGRGLEAGFLPEDEVREIARQGLAQLPPDGRRVLVLIPDGTRTMPMPLLFDALEAAIAPRARALDFLVALGTHPPMSGTQLSKLVGREVRDGRAGERRVFNHRWDDPASFATLGTIAKTDGYSWVVLMGGHRTATDVNSTALTGTTNRSPGTGAVAGQLHQIS